ncbi:MAG: archaellin/type IV pilin N-terminal domain-containing protein [archaeon]
MRKGVSPLIATVLLVALALTLGAVVMNFTQSSTYELKESASKKISREMKCSLDITIQLLEIGSTRYLCYNRSGSNNLEMILENQGSTSTQGVRIFLLDNNDEPLTRDVISEIGGHNKTKINVSIETTDTGQNFVFPPTKLIISPIISYADNSIDLCTDNRIDIEEFEVCT